MNWYEVWVDDGLTPPYVVVVIQHNAKEICVHDPKENDRIIYSSETYEEVKLWLLEDEYIRVTGRMELNEY